MNADPAIYASSPYDFVAVREQVYFITGGVSPSALWRTDGTATTLVAENDLSGSGPYFYGSFDVSHTDFQLTPVGDTLVFIAMRLDGDGESLALWSVDGSASLPSELVNFGPAVATTLVHFLNEFVVIGDQVYFPGWSPAHPARQVLWVTDGTTEGTMPTDIDIIDGVQDLRGANGLLYFVLHSAGGTYQLFVSDGTSGGTRALATVGYSDTSVHFAATTNVVYFTAYDPNEVMQLWKTDGTQANTTLVKSLGRDWRHHDYGYQGDSSLMTDVNGRLFFPLFDEQGHDVLWTSDGTDAGTFEVKSFSLSVGDRKIADLTPVGDLLYFTVDDGVHGREVWRSDGTAAGTYLLADVNPANWTSSGPQNLVNFDGNLYWSADDGVHGRELWMTDGTSAGTRRVTDLNPGAGSAEVAELAAIRGRLYFSANDGVHGSEPWYLDGNSPGDANGDGLVDAADYTVWSDHYLRPGVWGFAQGDFNRDGIVDGADYTIWADHYAPGVPPTPVTAASAPVSPPAPVSEATVSAGSARAELATLHWAAAIDRLFAASGDLGSAAEIGAEATGLARWRRDR